MRTELPTDEPPALMTGVTLPGNRQIGRTEVAVPRPGPGQVLLEVHASSICGSDIRAIYREHLGHGAEAYQGVIAGHEPAGRIIAVGADVTERAVGERVACYHIAGCGQCTECRHGYYIGCTSASRAAYGWQRHGGHAPYLLAQADTCIPLPDALSYADGALASCGFGTAYEGLLRLNLSGRDRLLITGLGPVGLAAGMLAKAMGAGPVVGIDATPERVALATKLGVVDHALSVDELGRTAELGRIEEVVGPTSFSAAIDCSGSAAGRHTAIEHLETWGRCVFVGEGSTLSLEPSPLLIHKQITLYGSWVTSLRHLQDLLGHLVRWGIRPEDTITHRFGLAEAETAYRLADEGTTGKICLFPHGIAPSKVNSE